MNKMRYKSIYFLISVLLLLFTVVFFQISDSYTRDMAKVKELRLLEEALLAEEERNEELNKMKVYIESDDFIVETAREEFHLIREGEVLFIQND